ncbi:hypothetical protein [Leisingera sp. ANG59]|uniref:hypothetical protein n=1 Tax=Leisingera sp. ANG59 TaxID=2675221 RepID=UPI00157397B8|nr:hypothetical protein [Leisingera sp. ANG59]NSY37950.1 hypothetical protein [Leisingera sp. ANG59]
MPLELLLALVLGGISGIAVLLHLTGRSRLAVLSAETARTGWLRHFPGDKISKVLPAASGQAVLVLTEGGPGLLWVFGADTVGRRLAESKIRETATGLRFEFNDFAAPGLSLPLSDGERLQWLALISPPEEAA